MPLINLIQEQILARRRQERQTRSAALAIVAVGLATAGGYGFLSFERERLKGEEARLLAEGHRLEPLIKQTDANNRTVADLKPRLDTLGEAQKTTDRWFRILSHLTEQTPRATWLTGLRAISTDASKPISLTLNGSSDAQQPIGEFILRVQNEPDLEGVTLHFTQEKSNNGGKMIDFEIGADVAGTDTPKPVEAKPEEAKS